AAREGETHHMFSAGPGGWTERTGAPTADGGTIGIGVDMTEREEAEEELKRHVSAHGEVLENLTTAIAIYGADTRLKFFNAAYAKLWRRDAPFPRGGPGFGAGVGPPRGRGRAPECGAFAAGPRAGV